MNFLENLTLLRSENPELEKVAYIAQDYSQNNSGHFDFSVILGELNGGQQNLFPAQKSELQSQLFTRDFTWLNNDTKEKIQRGC